MGVRTELSVTNLKWSSIHLKKRNWDEKRGSEKESDRWIERRNNELCRLYDEPCMTVLIMLERWRWAGYVQRTGIGGLAGNMLYSTTGGKRRLCRYKGMRSSLIWDVTQPRMVVTYRRFETTICPIFKGQAVQDDWSAWFLKTEPVYFPKKR